MKEYICSIILSALFLYSSAFSQPTIEVLAGMHYPVGLSKDYWWFNFLEDYWKPSINVGVRANIQIANSINLSPSVFYNHYLFNRYYDQGPGYEEVFVASSGESSEVFRFMIELQIMNQSDHLLRPYFAIGSGYVSEKIGTIHGWMQWLGNPEYSKGIGGSNSNYFTYTIGFGGIVVLSNDFSLDISAKYYSNTTDRSYILYSLGISCKIFN
jgi:hypothetical protein